MPTGRKLTPGQAAGKRVRALDEEILELTEELARTQRKLDEAIHRIDQLEDRLFDAVGETRQLDDRLSTVECSQ